MALEKFSASAHFVRSIGLAVNSSQWIFHSATGPAQAQNHLREWLTAVRPNCAGCRSVKHDIAREMNVGVGTVARLLQSPEAVIYSILTE